MTQSPTLLLSTAYLAPVSYYAHLFHAPHVIIEAHENYNKQTYRNRAFIGSAQGPQALSIPVEKGYKVKCPIREVRLSDHGEWRHQHLVALMSNYGNSPFYEYYIDDIAALINHPFTYLFDLNEALREKLCELIGFQPNVTYSEEYISPTPDQLDLREAIHPKRDFHVADPTFRPEPYYQVFDQRTPFMENLSILDLLFNMGNESLLVLQRGIR
jgi:hypothetical protein